MLVSVRHPPWSAVVLSEGSLLYDLKSVLIHRGPSAYSGHYVAHIHDSHADIWYKFNDEVIEKMGGKNLHLGNEEELGKIQAILITTPSRYCMFLAAVGLLCQSVHTQHPHVYLGWSGGQGGGGHLTI